MTQNKRTDLAVELQEGAAREIPGVRRWEQTLAAGWQCTWIRVKTPEAARALGKPCGTYCTLQGEDLATQSRAQLHRFAEEAAPVFWEWEALRRAERVLVVGLGNRAITPDAFGPRVCEGLFVTRHLRAELPFLRQEGYREVSAMVPGVMGVTGMQTREMVRGVVEQTRPDLVIAVDALASERMRRVGSVLQVSDTGIQPGSGLGSAPAAIDEAYLGVPVLAVGTPMVTYASVIAEDLIRTAFRGKAEEGDIAALAQAVGTADGAEWIVTPKHIDLLVRKAAEAVSMLLNLALHPAFDAEAAALLCE